MSDRRKFIPEDPERSAARLVFEQGVAMASAIFAEFKERADAKALAEAEKSINTDK